MSLLSIPTNAAFSPAQLLPSSHPSVTKTLQRLSRASLLALTLDWLSDQNQESELTTPYLAEPDSEDDEQDPYPAAHSLFELREIYTELQSRKGSKRDVVDRILEGDWRNGITLYQLAMADMQYLYDHPTSQKWTALKLVKSESDVQNHKKAATSVPRFHPATFLRNLQREVLPDIKVHYNLDRYEKLGLTILRVFIVDSPYNTSLALQSTSGRRAMAFDTSRTFYVAFPDAAPYIYISLTTTVSTIPGSSISDNKSLRSLVLDGIPKAFSRPRDRYSLESTNLSARNLEAMVEKRGGARSNAAGGGWGIYAEENKKDTPLNVHLPTPDSLHEHDGEKEQAEKVTGMKRRIEEDVQVVKRRKLVARGRFGNSAKQDDGKGIERFEVMIRDPFPSSAHNSRDDTPLDMPVEETSNGNGTKRKGRRSTFDLELSKQSEDDVEAEGWRPNVRVVFQGKHIFAGVRHLVEEGLLDGERMPGWMTGDEGVSVGLVQSGRIKGFKGSGL
ncbi:Sim4 complex subunit mis15 [Hyphodiscus hymeniophilus]|uniref:Sim4 complex subunit mis15 n=1 Tax=Hyphodiscus hymeniophilus TaxID=353542 RepID=A0A9P6SNB0_9HELO|nr:Sim4 complex subunit mis15 [Hyphodiscus hymeniophilus]